MNWIETQIITASAGVDALCAMLTDLGIKGFSIADPADFQEFLQNKEGKWDYIDQDLLGMAQGDTTVTVYLPDNAQGAEEPAFVVEYFDYPIRETRLERQFPATPFVPVSYTHLTLPTKA